MTWTWPLHPAPAPIPIVGTRSRSVMAAASCSGTSSMTIEKAPASWTACASASSARAWSRSLPWTLCLPMVLIDLGREPDVAHDRDAGPDERLDDPRAADAALDLDRLGAGLAKEEARVLERLLGRRRTRGTACPR